MSSPIFKFPILSILISAVSLGIQAETSIRCPHPSEIKMRLGPSDSIGFCDPEAVKVDCVPSRRETYQFSFHYQFKPLIGLKSEDMMESATMIAIEPEPFTGFHTVACYYPMKDIFNPVRKAIFAFVRIPLVSKTRCDPSLMPDFKTLDSGKSWHTHSGAFECSEHQLSALEEDTLFFEL